MGCGCKKRQQEQPVVPTPATIQVPQDMLTNVIETVQLPENNNDESTLSEENQ